MNDHKAETATSQKEQIDIRLEANQADGLQKRIKGIIDKLDKDGYRLDMGLGNVYFFDQITTPNLGFNFHLEASSTTDYRIDVRPTNDPTITTGRVRLYRPPLQSSIGWNLGITSSTDIIKVCGFDSENDLANKPLALAQAVITKLEDVIKAPNTQKVSLKDVPLPSEKKNATFINQTFF